MDDASIIVGLVDAKGCSLPVANVLVEVRFYMNGGGLRYNFEVGRTEGDGVVRSCLAAIQDQLDENRRYFLMDYNTPLSECSDEIGLHIPTPDDLAQREVNRLKYWPENEPPAKTANDAVRCPEQRFTLRRGAANQFELVCVRV